MRNFLLILLAIMVIVILTIPILKKQPQSDSLTMTISNSQQGTKATIKVKVADTPAKREQGYSNHPPIEYEEGLLFVFESPAQYPFWMKEMLFDLDFIMIRNGEIVEIVENVEAPGKNDTQPEIVNPTQSFDQLLEVKAGFVKKFGISLGDSVNL